MEILDRIREHMKIRFIKNGYVLTDKRLLVLYELMQYDDYVDVETFYIKMRDRYRISMGSVYLALKVMERIGLLSVRRNADSRKTAYRLTSPHYEGKVHPCDDCVPTARASVAS